MKVVFAVTILLVGFSCCFAQFDYLHRAYDTAINYHAILETVAVSLQDQLNDETDNLSTLLLDLVTERLESGATPAAGEAMKECTLSTAFRVFVLMTDGIFNLQDAHHKMQNLLTSITSELTNVNLLDDNLDDFYNIFNAQVYDEFRFVNDEIFPRIEEDIANLRNGQYWDINLRDEFYGCLAAA